MSLQDPIADMLTRIRNGYAAKKHSVIMPSSNMKKAIADVLKDEGYIADLRIEKEGFKTNLIVNLKYHGGVPVISKIKRVSRPGLRRYVDKASLPRILGGLGVAVISTSAGIISDNKARALGLGGEFICSVE